MVVEEHRGDTLRDYLRVLRRWKWLVLLVALIAPAIAVYISKSERSVYEASAIVLINRQDLGLAIQGVNDPTAYDSGRVLATQAGLARSPTVARRALRAVGVRRDASELLGSSSVAVNQAADFLTFSVRDHQPRLAALLATAYARQFTTYTNQIANGPATTALQSIQERLTRLRATGLTNSPLYVSLMKTEEQLKTIQAAQTSKAVVIREATGAGKIAPTPRRAGMIGAALGIALGLTLAFLAEALDTRVLDEEQIRRVLRVPLLGRLPSPEAPHSRVLATPLRHGRRLFRRKRPPRLVMLDEPLGVGAQSVRVCAANVEVAASKAGASSVMVTSAIPREGKTTTIANLAIALARQGRRVTLLEFDLHAPAFAQVLRLNAKWGVTDVAFRKASFDQAICSVDTGDLAYARIVSGFDSVGQETGDAFNVNGTEDADRLGGSAARLDVLCAGNAAPQLADVVPLEQMREIINRARERSDVVLLDTPPILLSGAAVALAAEVDAIITVCMISSLRTRLLDELKRVLDTCPARKLGFVLTDVDARPPYGYGRLYTLPVQQTEPAFRTENVD